MVAKPGRQVVHAHSVTAPTDMPGRGVGISSTCICPDKSASSTKCVPQKVTPIHQEALPFRKTHPKAPGREDGAHPALSIYWTVRCGLRSGQMKHVFQPSVL
jgi:hypothetical protein